MSLPRSLLRPLTPREAAAAALQKIRHEIDDLAKQVPVPIWRSAKLEVAPYFVRDRPRPLSRSKSPVGSTAQAAKLLWLLGPSYISIPSRCVACQLRIDQTHESHTEHAARYNMGMYYPSCLGSPYGLVHSGSILSGLCVRLQF